jgi:radical SAM protein with 4Fe4S-binding SPASM domain
MIKCPLPWTGIAVEPDGTVKNCAISRTKIGNLKYSTIESLLDNNLNRDIRTNLTDNTWPTACSQCERVEQLDPLFSNRAYQLDLHKDTDIDYTGTHSLTQLDLRWSNTCNYACVYCSPSLSSQWARELGEKVNIDRSNFDALKDYAFANLTNLKEVYLAGGEPLLIKENLELLEELYQVNPDCLVRITTNASILNNKIYDKIRLFKNVKWEVSVEATGQQFEYIRYPGVWSVFETNLRQLVSEWDNVGITMNYFLLTADTIIETGLYLNSLDIDLNKIAVHTITDPKFLDARNIKDLDRVTAYLNTYTETATTFGQSIQNCRDFLTKPFDKDLDNVVYSLNNIDQRRALDFTTTFPNLIRCLKT